MKECDNSKIHISTNFIFTGLIIQLLKLNNFAVIFRFSSINCHLSRLQTCR